MFKRPITEKQNEDELFESNENKVFAKDPINEKQASTVENDAIKMLQNDIAKLSDQIADLTKLFENKIVYSEHQEKIIDNMHKELQEYKNDMYSQVTKPILLDLIQVRESILEEHSKRQTNPEGEQNIPLNKFESYSKQIKQILKRNSIETYKCKAGTDFDATRQRALLQRPTTHERLHGKVAESKSDGYEYMGKTIEPENVTIYIFRPNK